MKAYKISFNGKQFELVEFDVINEFDFTHDPDVNLIGGEHMHNCDHDIVKERVDKLNAHIVPRFTKDILFYHDDDIMVKKCICCNKYFIIYKDEAKWFFDRNMVLPKRCDICRRKNKLEKEKESR